jgi:hypothetical protein
MEEHISDELLVSAYDIFYKNINPPFDFASAIILDSGGYEASKEYELSETFERAHIPKDWLPENYEQVVASWSATSPTLIVSFDHPEHRLPTIDQINRAASMPLPAGPYAKALLIKPESKGAIRVHIEKIIPHVPALTAFSVVGITEKEVGNSVHSRMLNIARLREALDFHKLEIPIHVFGSLDTITTYLYFLSGADIFDGLTWLRYAFANGDTVYKYAPGAINMPITTNSDIIEAGCWSHNYQYMRQMRLNMMKYLKDGSFEHFGKHHEIIKESFLGVNAELVGG